MQTAASPTDVVMRRGMPALASPKPMYTQSFTGMVVLATGAPSWPHLIRDYLDNEGYRLQRSLSLNCRNPERE